VFRIVLGGKSTDENECVRYLQRVDDSELSRRISYTSENALKNYIIEIIERDILCLTLVTI